MRSTLATTTEQVTIGKVSDRKGARQHLDVAGRAHCNAGRGVIAAATRYVVDGSVATDTVCRRCLKALRAALATAAATGDTAAADGAYMLTPKADADARDAAMLADLRAFHRALDAAAVPAPVVWNYRELLLADLRAEAAADPRADDLLFA